MSMIVDPRSQDLVRPRGRSRAVPLPQTVVLLAGGSGLKDFVQATGRSVLDLPVADGLTVGQHWQREIHALSSQSWADPIDVRIVGGSPSATGAGSGESGPLVIQHMNDPRELRGTGGILKDLTEGHADEEFILVTSAATLLLEPLTPLVQELFATRSDVAFFVDEEDLASNLMLVRCGCLRGIPEVGFVDFKEQAMPRIAAAGSVTVIRRPMAVAASLRTAPEYLRALRAFHTQGTRRADSRGLTPGSAFSEAWEPAFGLSERAARLGEGVRLHDSVVLEGASVGEGAVLVRSIVCPGVVVPAQTLVVDELLSTSAGKRDRAGREGKARARQ